MEGPNKNLIDNNDFLVEKKTNIPLTFKEKFNKFYNNYINNKYTFIILYIIVIMLFTMLFKTTVSGNVHEDIDKWKTSTIYFMNFGLSLIIFMSTLLAEIFAQKYIVHEVETDIEETGTTDMMAHLNPKQLQNVVYTSLKNKNISDQESKLSKIKVQTIKKRNLELVDTNKKLLQNNENLKNKFVKNINIIKNSQKFNLNKLRKLNINDKNKNTEIEINKLSEEVKNFNNETSDIEQDLIKNKKNNMNDVVNLLTLLQRGESINNNINQVESNISSNPCSISRNSDSEE